MDIFLTLLTRFVLESQLLSHEIKLPYGLESSLYIKVLRQLLCLFQQLHHEVPTVI